MAQLRYKFPFYSALICVLLFLSGCGKDSDDAATVVITPPISGNQNFVEKVRSTAYFCDEAECPSYTVAVAVNNLGNVDPTWCTGTVLKNGQVLTSRSCFGDFFFEAQTSCQENVLIKTLADEVYGCRDVIAVSTPSVSAKDPAAKIEDYVLLDIPKIKANKYPTLAEGKGLLTPGQDASLWIVHHWFESGLEVALENKKCPYQNQSLISPWGKLSESSHIFISKCDLPPSAKGAVVLDSRNEIGGIIHSISKKEDLDVWEQRVLEGEKLSHYALGNSFACTILKNKEHDYCDQQQFTDSKLISIRNEIFMEFNDLDKWQAHVEEFAETTQHKYLKWTAKLRYINSELLYSADFIPTCFTSADVWLQEFRGGLFNMFYDQSGSVFAAWPNYQLYSGLDGHFNLTTDLQDAGEMLYEIKFSPRDLKKKSRSNLTVINTLTNQVVIELKDVTFCH